MITTSESNQESKRNMKEVRKVVSTGSYTLTCAIEYKLKARVSSYQGGQNLEIFVSVIFSSKV